MAIDRGVTQEIGSAEAGAAGQGLPAWEDPWVWEPAGKGRQAALSSGPAARVSGGLAAVLADGGALGRSASSAEPHFSPLADGHIGTHFMRFAGKLSSLPGRFSSPCKRRPSGKGEGSRVPGERKGPREAQGSPGPPGCGAVGSQRTSL